ncbi:MAG: glycosyltransferase family 2 protein, partial [Nitrospira sp.]|nr:glycosyltransferase family 2 protein [Nitrospira sp.]
MDVSIVMPVFNERAALRESLDRVLATGIPGEIIIVDDGSVDGTSDVLKDIERSHLDACALKVVYQAKNQGKGAAVRRGFQEVSKSIVIIQDADLEYN